jgi:hypothetical protein
MLELELFKDVQPMTIRGSQTRQRPLEPYHPSSIREEAVELISAFHFSRWYG